MYFISRQSFVLTKKFSGRVFAFLTLVIMAINNVMTSGSAVAEDYLQAIPAPKKALVIGASEYRNIDSLSAAATDSDAMERKLIEFGFSVHRASGSRRGDIIAAVKTFAAGLRQGDIAVVYYTGHGLQSAGFNYLVPTDVPRCLGDPNTIVLRNVPVTYIKSQLSKKHLAAFFIILDACRTAPFDCHADSQSATRSFRSDPDSFAEERIGGSFRQGLAAPRQPRAPEVNTSMLVAFASSPGRPAWTGADTASGSIYTRELIRYFGQPGWDLDRFFKKVRSEVLRSSQQKQRPWEQNSMVGVIFINPDAEIEREYRSAWQGAIQSAKDLGDRQSVLAYLEYFPSSPYAAMARKWLVDYPPTSDSGGTPDLIATSAISIEGTQSSFDVAMVSPTSATRGATSQTRGIAPATEQGSSFSGTTLRVPNFNNINRNVLTEGEQSTGALTNSQTFKYWSVDRPEHPAISQIWQKKKNQKTGPVGTLQFVGDTQVRNLYVDVKTPKGVQFDTSSPIKVRSIKSIEKKNQTPARTTTDWNSTSQDPSLNFSDLFKPESTSAKKVDFDLKKNDEVQVELSDDLKGAKTQGLARLHAFKRSLVIRKQLKNAGVSADKIKVKMPKRFRKMEPETSGTRGTTMGTKKLQELDLISIISSEK